MWQPTFSLDHYTSDCEGHRHLPVENARELCRHCPRKSSARRVCVYRRLHSSCFRCIRLCCENIVSCGVRDSCNNDNSKEHCTCGRDYVTRLFTYLRFRFCIYSSVKCVRNFPRADSSICDRKVKLLKNVLHNLQPGKMEHLMAEAVVCFSCTDLGVISTGKCFSSSKTERVRNERCTFNLTRAT